jgi:uncharacterized membrane protein YwzB
MTKLQVFGYSIAGVMLSASTTFAALFDSQGDGSKLKGAAGVGTNGIMDLIAKFLGFITIIAVLYIIWAGFQILTAGGDEEKVKKGRTTVIQVVIGIIVIWLAYTIVNLIVNSLV